jgi:hypothetical protein
MRSAIPALGLALGLAVNPAVSTAEGFTTLDLGSIPTDAECLERAKAVFDEFDWHVQIGEVVATSWNISAFDVGGDSYDAHMVCAYGPNDQTRVTLVVYFNDTGNEETANDYGERMKLLWSARD